MEDIPAPQLVIEYIKIHFRHKAMRRGVQKALASDFIDNLRFVFLLVVAVLVFLVEMLIWVDGVSFGGCLFVFSSFWFILVGMGLGWIDGMFI